VDVTVDVYVSVALRAEKGTGMLFDILNSEQSQFHVCHQPNLPPGSGMLFQCSEPINVRELVAVAESLQRQLNQDASVRKSCPVLISRSYEATMISVSPAKAPTEAEGGAVNMGPSTDTNIQPIAEVQRVVHYTMATFSTARLLDKIPLHVV